MKIFFILLFVLVNVVIKAQTTSQLKIVSRELNELRIVDLILPNGYQDNKQKYPVIYCLDGEYTQFPVQSSINFNTYLDKFPPCIVVAIHQNYADSLSSKYKRWDDCDFDPKEGELSEKGMKFYQFISKELVPKIDSLYTSSSFRIIVGHSFTANYINYFLMEDKPIFRAYLSISPYYDLKSSEKFTNQINQIKTPVFYYNAVGQYDLKGHIASVNQFNKNIKAKLKNPHFSFDWFKLEDNALKHYSILEYSITDGLKSIFSKYQTIGNEYNSLVKAENKLRYLENYYTFLKAFYDVDFPIRLEDYEAVAEAAKEGKQFEQLNEIAKKCLNAYPNNWVPYYMLGDVEKQQKNYANALNYYEMGFQKLGDEVLNKDDFYHDISELKKLIEATKK